MSATVINSFKGDYAFLSNFYPCRIRVDGIVYPSVENAYVAAKFDNHVIKRKIATMDSGEAKVFGRNNPITTPNWDDVKVDIMRELIDLKFLDNNLAAKLIATDPLLLIEGNTWGDRFWGMCQGEGENMLGRILMQQRAKLIKVANDFCAAMDESEKQARLFTQEEREKLAKALKELVDARLSEANS